MTPMMKPEATKTKPSEYDINVCTQVLSRPEREIALARYERNLTQELRALERSTAIILRNEDKINDELLRTIERELDLGEARFQDA